MKAENEIKNRMTRGALEMLYSPTSGAEITKRLRRSMEGPELTPAEKLDMDIFGRRYQKPWKIATVKTDYGSVIDFTKLGTAEKEMLLADPTFAESVVHKTWSQHPGGVFLPCKRKREWTDKEAERLAVWRISKKLERAKAAA